jgi:hypothetical protein
VQGHVGGQQVPVLELALDVARGQGDRSLAQADGMQVVVGGGQAEFLARLADALGIVSPAW